MTCPLPWHTSWIIVPQIAKSSSPKVKGAHIFGQKDSRRSKTKNFKKWKGANPHALLACMEGRQMTRWVSVPKILSSLINGLVLMSVKGSWFTLVPPLWITQKRRECGNLNSWKLAEHPTSPRTTNQLSLSLRPIARCLNQSNLHVIDRI